MSHEWRIGLEQERSDLDRTLRLRVEKCTREESVGKANENLITRNYTLTILSRAVIAYYA